MTLRPFAPSEFDALWASVSSADPTVAVGTMDPELLRERVGTSGQMTERELLLAVETDGRLVGSIQGYRGGLPDGVFELGIELFDEADRGNGYGTAAVKALVTRLFDSEGARKVEAEPRWATPGCSRCLSGSGSDRRGSVEPGTPPTTAPGSIA